MCFVERWFGTLAIRVGNQETQKNELNCGHSSILNLWILRTIYT
jgi:hypothetical protein